MTSSLVVALATTISSFWLLPSDVAMYVLNSHDTSSASPQGRLPMAVTTRFMVATLLGAM